jgi:ComF family protein
VNPSTRPDALAVTGLVVRHLAATALDVLAPRRCSACDLPVRRRAAFCGGCAATVAPADRDTSQDLACFALGGAIGVALYRLKYQSHPELGTPLGVLMAQHPALRRAHFARVVPVPLHPRRLVARGYNQAALLAAPIARALEVPLDTSTLSRVAETCPQVGLDRSARALNVARAFSAERPTRARESGGAVLLVDDVRTTGATLAACKSALASAGARDVITFTLAQAEADR